MSSLAAALASLLLATVGDARAEPPDDDVDDDEVVIVDDDDGSTRSAVKGSSGGDDDDDDVIDDEGETNDVTEASSTSQTMFNGVFDSRAMLDLAWDGGGEDIFVLRNRFALNLAYEPNPFMRVVAAGHFVHKLLVDDGTANAHSPLRSTIEAQLDETYVLWRFEFGMDLTVGHRIITWGRTDFSRPLSVLNPLDLRDDPLERNDTNQLPVWSVEVAQRAGPVTISLVWIPWFRPHSVDWVGTDWAVLKPALQGLMPGPLQDAFAAVDPSRYEEVQAVFQATEDPPDDGITGADLGVRLTTTLGGVDMGLAYAYQWDRVPVIRFDDSFGAALKATLDGVPDSSDDLQAAFSSRYERRHVVGADFNFTAGPVGIKGDVAFSSDRTFYRRDLTALRKPSLHWAVQLDFMYEFIFDASLEFSHLAIFGLEASAELAIVDNHMLKLTGVMNMRLSLELMVSVMTEWVISHGDVMLSPRFIWRLSGLASLEVGVGIFVAGQDGIDALTFTALSDNADYVYLNSILSF